MNAVPVPYYPYGDMMRYIAGQLADGEVERREFVPSASAGGWPVAPDEDTRRRVESFVLNNTPSAHRFLGADGHQRVVYMDERGRAVDTRLSDIPDADLVRIARRYGMKIGATNGGDEPTTSRTDHGYRKPVTESMQFSDKQLARAAKDFGREAGGEEVSVEQIGSTIYVLGSELAVLRLYHKRKGAGRAGYSENLKRWYYTPKE